jgi:acetylglutamate kinase
MTAVFPQQARKSKPAADHQASVRSSIARAETGHYVRRVATASQLVLTFLRSVGKHQEAEYYLRLFQDLPKASFAVIGGEPEVFDQAPTTVLGPVRFLSQLGLFPVLALGLLGRCASSTAPKLQRTLSDLGTEVDWVDSSTAHWTAQTKDRLSDERAVVLDLSPLEEDQRQVAICSLLQDLNTRKLAILRSAGGLGPKETGRVSLTKTHHLVTSESGISVINLKTDYESLAAGQILDEGERSLLTQARELHSSCQHLMTSIASPLNLLRELFTIRGAGTLIKTGSTIDRFDGYAALDFAALRALLEGTFKRRLSKTFSSREPLHVYLEADYRGVAIVTQGTEAVFLTKFAVMPKAQGEGIGRDLWEAMLRDHHAVYWRARADNPATSWYEGECDGMHLQGDWRVYWRGIAAGALPRVIEDALCRPKDFEEEP